VKKDQTFFSPVIFANYAHSKGLEFSKEIDGQQLIYDCLVWKVATATLSTPPFHRPQRIGTHYLVFVNVNFINKLSL
jgi:hypothetical protein